MTEPSDNTSSIDFSPDSTNSTVPRPWDDLFYPIRPELPPEMEDFRLCDILGSGSSGTVYRSVQTKEFAVKVMPWHPKNYREIAKREYDIARLFFDCETTVHAIAYYEHDSNSYILQEIGEPITDYFFKHPCSLRELLQALLDISKALSYIHSKGYIHFDVKPDNVLMIKGKARLGDFSHCRRYVQDQEYERSIGTSAFMAPEIVSGAKHSGLEDMYSLGITMYALLMAGLLPFDEKADASDKKNLRINSFFIHPDLLAIIRKAAAYNPCDRYQTFEEFSKDIQAFMASYDDDLDEKVPQYISNDLRKPTLPPFCDTPAINNNQGKSILQI